MRVISQSGTVDVPYENFVFSCTEDNYIVCTRDTVAPPSEIARAEFAKYSSRGNALKAMERLHNAYAGIIKGLNVDISADTAEKIQEMMKTGYGMLIAEESYNGDRLEFYPMNTVFRFPADEELEG